MVVNVLCCACWRQCGVVRICSVLVNVGFVERIMCILTGVYSFPVKV